MKFSNTVQLSAKSNLLNSVPNDFLWFWLAWFMVFNPTFNNIQLYCGGQFYLWGKPGEPDKTTGLLQVTDKLYHIMLHRVHLPMNGVRTQRGDRH
jgi:hypothetical protein